MKIKIITSCLFLFFLFNNNQSIAQAFENGNNVISIGLGIGSALGDYNYSSQTPGISLQYEHGQWSVGGPGVISLGGYLGVKSYSYDATIPGYSYSQKWNYTVIGVRGAYHYNGIQNKLFDVYGGLMLGYDIVSYKFSSSNPVYDNLYNHASSSGISLSPFIGGRYFFTDNLAVFAELGYGVTYFSIGAALKF